MKKKSDKKEPLPNKTNQKRTVGMFLDKNNFKTVDQDNQFTKMASNPCGGGKKR